MEKSTPKHTRRLRRNMALLLIPAVFSALAVYLLWHTHPELSYWLDLLDQGHTLLEANPWALIAGTRHLAGNRLSKQPGIDPFRRSADTALWNTSDLGTGNQRTKPVQHLDLRIGRGPFTRPTHALRITPS
ncbi:hypothetical protein SH580_17890 [Coraliomargarita algicola]|uniref:Uncharacterized protein n=1 Tax=Coraliomargarita algicola TaxID=3092156 RepID=A0ABZ0RZ15_9BACT|nr:hypothetical protein [Coraliomargarita sp. J2-16]WPJ98239.1 hypothetical protein SH580_17890 [Coraliomargarita sp. J2-16]